MKNRLKPLSDNKAQEEAKRIVERFLPNSGDNPLINITPKDNAKQCALICVDEILKEYELMAPTYERKKHWQQVKAEILKMK